jgi:hypothetical protein
MQVELIWAGIALVAGVVGGSLGIILTRLVAKSRVYEAEWKAKMWQRYCVERDREIEELMAALAEIRGCARAAGRREELASVLASVLADEPGAWSGAAGDRVIADLVEERDLPMFPTRPGAEKYPFAAAAGLVAPSGAPFAPTGPEISDVWPGYAESIEAREKDEC